MDMWVLGELVARRGFQGENSNETNILKPPLSTPLGKLIAALAWMSIRRQPRGYWKVL